MTSHRFLANPPFSNEGMVNLMMRSLPMTLLIDIYLNRQEGLLWREGPQRLDLILYPSRLSCIREGLERSGSIGEDPGRSGSIGEGPWGSDLFEKGQGSWVPSRRVPKDWV